MRNFDLTPLFRSSIGFDRFSELFESTLKEDNNISYPPYNIEKTSEDCYAITMAIAGFKEDDVTITHQKNLLTIIGKMSSNQKEITYLYKGIANRGFERKFNLADYMKITNADLNHGILRIDLIREIPEEVKPKQIFINNNKSLTK